MLGDVGPEIERRRERRRQNPDSWGHGGATRQPRGAGVSERGEVTNGRRFSTALRDPVLCARAAGPDHSRTQYQQQGTETEQKPLLSCCPGLASAPAARALLSRLTRFSPWPSVHSARAPISTRAHTANPNARRVTSSSIIGLQPTRTRNQTTHYQQGQRQTASHHGKIRSAA